MWSRSTVLFVLLGGLPGCGASSPTASVNAAELQAQSARADAMLEHARFIELEARLIELEHRFANQTRPCEATPDPGAVSVASSRDQPKTESLRSEGDFLAEAHAVARAARPPAASVAVGAAPQPKTAASTPRRLEQLLEELREYGFEPQSGLSLERREALRVLLRRERQLDLMNPWGDH